MRRRDWALIALSASPNGSLAPVQVQKAMFLLAENTRPETDEPFYQFTPYHYGPFDQRVYADLERLIDEGLVRRTKSKRYSGMDFEITDFGRRKALSLERHDSSITQYLKAIVAWMAPLSFSELVSAIYQSYPRFREKSIFRG